MLSLEGSFRVVGKERETARWRKRLTKGHRHKRETARGRIQPVLFFYTLGGGNHKAQATGLCRRQPTAGNGFLRETALQRQWLLKSE